MWPASSCRDRRTGIAVYENNDSNQRMLAAISFNNDIGDYMEWSSESWFPVNLSKAYKFTTNFIVYGLTD